MEGASNVVGQIAPDAAPDGTTDKATRVKLAKALPSDRISFDRQTVLLRCYAIGAGTDNKAVSNQQIGDLAKVHPSTVSMNTMFYSDAGLILKAPGGYVPSQEVISFQRAFQFNADTAGQKLAPALRRSWFGQALLPKLSVGPRSEDEALGELAEVSNAQPEHKAQLMLLLDWLAFGGVIERDGTLVRQGKMMREDGQPARSEDTTVTAQTVTPAPTITKGVATQFAANPSGGAAGGLNLSVSISVDMAEMATWPPQVVTAFMAGLAQVITAKAAAEGSATR